MKPRPCKFVSFGAVLRRQARPAPPRPTRTVPEGGRLVSSIDCTHPFEIRTDDHHGFPNPPVPFLAGSDESSPRNAGEPVPGSWLAVRLGLGNPATMLRAALRYARRGWRVFPVTPGSKAPLIKKWPDLATSDPRTIKGWFHRWPDANVGICTGNGLLVIDIDPRNGGDDVREAGEGEQPTPGDHNGGHRIGRASLVLSLRPKHEDQVPGKYSPWYRPALSGTLLQQSAENAGKSGGVDQ